MRYRDLVLIKKTIEGLVSCSKQGCVVPILLRSNYETSLSKIEKYRVKKVKKAKKTLEIVEES